MKVYVRTNYASDEPAFTLNVIVDIFDPNYSIASSRSIFSVDESDDDIPKEYRPIVDISTGETAQDLYDDLIIQVRDQILTSGFKILRKKPSGNKSEEFGDSNSWYYDICLKDKYKARTARIVFFLRISDHQEDYNTSKDIAERRSKGYTEEGHKTKNRNGKRRQIYFGEKNNNGGVIEPRIKNIIVGTIDCNSIAEALRALAVELNMFKIAESRPFTRQTALSFVKTIKDKLRAETLMHSWEIGSDANDMHDTTDFYLFFKEAVNNKWVDKIILHIEYDPSLYGDYVVVTIRYEKPNMIWSNDIELFRVQQSLKGNPKDTQKNILDHSKIRGMYTKYLKKLVTEIDQRT